VIPPSPGRPYAPLGRRPYAEVIGDPIAQSKSPVIHRFWARALGLDADYRAVRVAADALGAYLAERSADPHWRGCNVTMPHKLAVMAHLGALDPLAEAAGAVNTVVRRDGRLVGYNTDVAGVLEPLDRAENGIGGYPNHVATYAQVIGAGGAARAAGAALVKRFDVEFYNRTADKAVELAALFGLPEAYGAGLDTLRPIRGDGEGSDDQRYSHVIVNASAMGMAGQPPVPVDLDAYYPDTVVFDMVYAPLETPLLAAARARGLRTVDGLQMLVGQAAVAFERFFGHAPPRDRDDELRALLTA